MKEELKLAWALVGLLIASGLLTYFTRPTEHIVTTAVKDRKKKRDKKLRLENAQPYMTEEGFVALDIDNRRAKSSYIPKTSKRVDLRDDSQRSESPRQTADRS